MSLVRPERLSPGDRVAAISMSAGLAAAFPARYETGKRQIKETLGLEVVETENALRDVAWLHAHPRERAEDLMRAFEDPSIKGVFSIIGGEDSIRVLPFLDLERLRRHPKVFLGYSDSTVVHLALHRAGIGSFFGPAILSDFAENGGIFPFTLDAVRRTLFSADPIGPLAPNTEGWTSEFLDWGDPRNQSVKRALNACARWKVVQGKGAVRGRLFGGTLTVLEMLRGTAFWPEPSAWEGAVLFLEYQDAELGQPFPSHYLRFALRSWAAMGLIQRLAAILIGRMYVESEDVPRENVEAEYLGQFEQVVHDECGLDTPILYGLDFGHTEPKLVLPYGVLAEVECSGPSVTLLEAAVR